MHVAGWFTTVGGGLAWAYDVDGLEELRARLPRRKVGWGLVSEGVGERKSEDEREVEGLVKRALGRRGEENREEKAGR